MEFGVAVDGIVLTAEGKLESAVHLTSGQVRYGKPEGRDLWSQPAQS
jgi:hypothetical protein